MQTEKESGEGNALTLERDLELLMATFTQLTNSISLSKTEETSFLANKLRVTADSIEQKIGRDKDLDSEVKDLDTEIER